MPEYTVKEFATRERVTERTVHRWIEKGAVDVRRTPGGRIRISDPAQQGSRVAFLMTSQDTSGHFSR